MTGYLHRRTLNTIVALDAATCIGMGLLLVFVSGPVGQLTQIPSPLLFWAGLLLLPVAVFMALTAKALQPPAWVVLLIVAGNLLWIAVSLALPMTGAIAPNATGWALLLAQAAVVALFSILEWSARPSAISAI